MSGIHYIMFSFCCWLPPSAMVPIHVAALALFAAAGAAAAAVLCCSACRPVRQLKSICLRLPWVMLKAGANVTIWPFALPQCVSCTLMCPIYPGS